MYNDPAASVISPDRKIVGRFAPSPTGPLHFGSLVAAIGSYLQARQAGGRWLVRMEDVDRPREMAGAADSILRALEHFGLEWDGPVWYQSRRTDFYEAALQQLQQTGLLYPCACSRKEIADSATTGIDGLIYPGSCREGVGTGKGVRAWRVRVQDELLQFTDKVQGLQGHNLAREIGDFVVKRADGLFAYQLAVVVDDAGQGVTEVVRGADLLLSTPRQIYLQQLLNLAAPVYAHLPVALNAQGEKLSKQTLAPSVAEAQPARLWPAVLAFLGHPLPLELVGAEVASVRAWALQNWDMERVPKVMGQAVVNL